MRKFVAAGFSAILVLSFSPGVLAGKKAVPERIVQARSVAVGYDLGDRFVSEGASPAEPGVGPEERRALQAVSQEFRRWGRYAVVTRPQEADLLVGIRLRRSARASSGIGGGVSDGAGGLGGTFDGSVRRGSSYNIDYSANDDALSVYDGADGKVGKLLWHKTKAYGLTGDNPALVAQFRTDVERTPATPGPAATKPPQ